jgi:PAS domain S-box-containing protein
MLSNNTAGAQPAQPAHANTVSPVSSVSAEERYRAFIENSTEGIWRFDTDEPVDTALPEDEQIEAIYRQGFLAEANDAFARMHGFSRGEEMIGARLGDLLVRDNPASDAFLRAFIRSGYRLANAESVEPDRNGSPRHISNTLTGVVEDGRLVRAWGTQRDITAQREAERHAERVVAELRLITDAAPLLISYVDADLRYRFVNQTYREWFGMAKEQIIGCLVEDVIGPAAFAQVRPRLLAVLSGERVSYEGELRYQGAGRRYVDIKLVPDTVLEEKTGVATVRGYVAVITDITDRRQAERRQQFLSDLSERTRFLADPEAVVWEAVTSVGTFLGLDRYMFADIDQTNDTVTVHRDYVAPGVEGLFSVAGVWPLAPWGAVLNDFRAGRTIVNSDYQTDPRTAGDWEAIYRQTAIRANLTVPCFRDSEWVGVFSAQMSFTPRDWTPEDQALLEAVAERMWNVLENVRLRQAEREATDRLRFALAAARQRTWEVDLVAGEVRISGEFGQPRAAPNRRLGHFPSPAAMTTSTRTTESGCGKRSPPP